MRHLLFNTPHFVTKNRLIRSVLNNYPLIEKPEHSVSGLRTKTFSGEIPITVDFSNDISEYENYVIALKKDGDLLELSRTYKILAELEPGDSFASIINKAKYYKLAANAIFESATALKKGLIQLDFETEFFELFSNQISEQFSESIELTEKSASTYLRLSDHCPKDCAYEYLEISSMLFLKIYQFQNSCLAIEKSYQFGNPKGEILISIIDILNRLEDQDIMGLENIKISLLPLADEASKGKTFSDTAHIYAVVAFLEQDQMLKFDLLKKAAVAFARLKEHPLSSLYYLEASEYAPNAQKGLCISFAKKHLKL